MKLFPAPSDNRFLSMKAEIGGTSKGRCWAPLVDCKNPPIRAHSIQNSRILESLQENGVVSKIGEVVRDKETYLAFENVGRNKATTFRGFCAEHDAALFKVLDEEPMGALSKRQKALLTWRAISHEMADKMAIGSNFQNQYAKAIARGEASADEPHPFGMEAIAWMKVLHDFFIYRQRHLDGYITGQADLKEYRLKHYILKGTGAIVAASSFFTFEKTEQAYMAFNVYPWDGDTHVLFGYSREHTRLAAPLARSILTKGQVDEAKLSALIIGRMHNFVLKPSVVSSWTDQKREEILAAYGTTIISTEALPPLQNTNLFSS